MCLTLLSLGKSDFVVGLVNPVCSSPPQVVKHDSVRFSSIAEAVLVVVNFLVDKDVASPASHLHLHLSLPPFVAVVW